MKLFEEFKEDLFFYINTMLETLLKDAKKWFKSGMLSSEGDIEALYFEKHEKGLNPYAKVIFENDNYRFDAIFSLVTEEVLELEDMSKKDDINITLTIKAYTSDMDFLTQKAEDVLYKDLNEDFLLSLISDIKEEIEEIEDGEDG